MLILLIFQLSACAAEPEPCGLPATANDTGAEIHACAQSCENAQSGLACCLEAEGWGAEEAEGVFCGDLECLGDPACDDATCDPRKIITREAAICIAQVDGLAPGLRGHRASFLGTTEAIWDVASYWWTTCDTEIGESASLGRWVSGRSGKIIVGYEEIGTGCLPGWSPGD